VSRRTFSISAASQRSLRFLVALGLLIYEAIGHDGEPRWLLIAIYGTMMGLPLAEYGDELRRRAMGMSPPPIEGGGEHDA